jgi:hypothetical protein
MAGIFQIVNKGAGKTMTKDIGEGIGCLLLCIGAAIIIWALSGFPGLVQ